MNFGTTCGIGIGLHKACGPLGASFDVLSIPGLNVWMHKDDADGTIGGAVTNWPNRVVGSTVPTQSDASKKPTKRAGWIEFNGSATADEISITPFTPSSGQRYVFLAYTNLLNVATYLFTATAPGATTEVLDFAGSPGQVSTFLNGGNEALLSETGMGFGQNQIIRLNFNPGVGHSFSNLKTGTNGASVLIAGGIGGWTTLLLKSHNSGLIGIKEVILVSGVTLTPAELSSIQSYLISQWG